NPKDVLGETVTRVLGGSRTWPRDVPFTVFFCNVIRSVADDFRNAARSEAAESVGDIDAVEGAERQGGGDIESQAADRALLVAIWKLFEGDDDARALLQGIEEGLTANEVQTRFDLSESRYGAARKRLERTLAKHYPNGMKS